MDTLSYSQWSEGDLYAFESVDGYGICMNCPFCGTDNVEDWADFTCDTRLKMISHIEGHIKAGFDVPDRAIEQLRKDLERYGNNY